MVMQQYLPLNQSMHKSMQDQQGTHLEVQPELRVHLHLGVTNLHDHSTPPLDGALAQDGVQHCTGSQTSGFSCWVTATGVWRCYDLTKQVNS